MPAVRVRRVVRLYAQRQRGLTRAARRSIYQDIPLHTYDEFLQLAPEPARTEDVQANEHVLMLNRLSFELSERQRSVFPRLAPATERH